MLTQEDVEKRFAYHKPRDQGVSNLHDIIRHRCKMLATMFNEILPSCRETALTMTHLEEVMFWANAAVARTQPNTKPEPNTLPTYCAVLTIGMREGYNGPVHTEGEALDLCALYCNDVGLGLEIHFGKCVYTGGLEPCARISLINYPRFPKSSSEVYGHAETLGMKIAQSFKQQRFTIVATDKTVTYDVR